MPQGGGALFKCVHRHFANSADGAHPGHPASTTAAELIL
jgi:hypothetical protein